MPRILENMKSKAGPLPVWGWSLIGGGVLAGGYYYYRHKKAVTTSANAAVQTAQDGSGPNSSMVVARPLGTLPDSALTDQGMSGTSINPATGNSYASDASNPIDPLTNVPYAQEVAAAAGTQQALQTQLEALQNAANNSQGQNGPPAAQPAPSIVTPAPPPHPAPHLGPVGGRQVGPWETEAERNKAVGHIPAGRVRKFRKGGKYYAEIFP